MRCGWCIVPAINEELGATAVWGSQVVSQLPGAQVDGVLGVWYGEAPGVDRAGDALRHGNFSGAHPTGGMLALCGDDATCKSSTLPSESESGLAALRMPVVFPGNPAEVLELGRHAIGGSRASGLWFAVKIATNVADAVMTVDVSPDLEIRPVSVDYGGAPYVHAPSGSLFNPFSLEMERTLAGPRMDLARAYARANGLNRVSARRSSFVAWPGCCGDVVLRPARGASYARFERRGSARPRGTRSEARDDLAARSRHHPRVQPRA